jgi:hypothetical protein
MFVPAGAFRFASVFRTAGFFLTGGFFTGASRRLAGIS